MQIKRAMILAAAWMLLGAAGAVSAKQTGLSALDKTYMKGAAQSNLMEIRLKPLVLKRGVKFETRDYARYLARDHARMNRRLIALATRKGVTLPGEISSGQRAVLGRLAREPKRLFDAAYKHEVIREHSEEMAQARREVSQGHDRQVRSYAKYQLGFLKLHRGMAYSLPGYTPHIGGRRGVRYY